MCPADPTLFWSAGEDGIIRQYDARLPDQKSFSSPNVLVSLMSAGGCDLTLFIFLTRSSRLTLLTHWHTSYHVKTVMFLLSPEVCPEPKITPGANN